MSSLTTLVERWRERAAGLEAAGYASRGLDVSECADELESALAAERGAGRDIRGVEVFALLRGWPYEGEDFVGVFRDLDAAKTAAVTDAMVWPSAAHFIYPTPINELSSERPWSWRLLRGEWLQSTPTPEASRGE